MINYDYDELFEPTFNFENLSLSQQILLAYDIKKLKKDIRQLGCKPLVKNEIIEIIREPREESHIKMIMQQLIIKDTVCFTCGKIISYKTRKPKYCTKCNLNRRKNYMVMYMRKIRANQMR